MVSLSQSNFPIDENVIDNYADELKDSPGDFTPEDERSGREEEETDDDSISLAEAILMKIKEKKGKQKENLAPLALEAKLKQRENQEERQVEVKTGQTVWLDIICSKDVDQKMLIFTNIKTVKNGEYYDSKGHNTK